MKAGNKALRFKDQPGFVGLGVEGFHVKQITGDSGAGATLGEFEGSTAGVGPCSPTFMASLQKGAAGSQ